ncbi:MAG: phenylalanine--tRNA ligase subunit alpha [Candidatus Magasanikbacteria bacterium CG10_big_fil_rev_8_21_14_0_10_43_6]|uniref:Phenylalanine--tRNA ligase alpha subunit n=1 Tax=Candidatus Magasanikbacteria bacterium CG10_big_fil_rev_8_21_14_0_10_43_6 TaxID=1974650 RepID=A0A2M6W072_9BACT|nr:MAG: phenylalanine--tRNA ligase subunit alpha [Candidatus Magasanikbacteria bacterium CG10_big_fil_rev_8_21_14_0_10_43_6]
MKDQFEAIKKEFQQAIKDVADFAHLEAIEKRFFSRKSGEFSQLMKGMKDLSDDIRKDIGKFANVVKDDLEEMLVGKREELDKEKLAKLAQAERIDATQALVSKEARGHIHPLTQGSEQMEDVLSRMGFLVEDGPELESQYFVFDVLNISEHHPARDAQDTFYIKDHTELCMRSHTSNMQVRLMRKYNNGGTEPVRAAVPGRVFRNEALDATHEHTFYQMEGFIVDREINIGHLVGVLKELLGGLLKQQVEVRLRPSYFPFVEPGFELDMKTDLGKGEKWMEMLGCGLIHPHVLTEAGYDATQWQGFAFGMGINRLIMAKYGIEDIRHFMSGDLRFLNQF